MHFGKPQPEYYEEILVRLDIDASEAIMVGDDWVQDIAPALACGLHTFWISKPSISEPPGRQPDGWGTLEQFAERVHAGWLDNIPPRTIGYEGLIRRLAAFPAGVAAAMEGYSDTVLECAPSGDEWAARDIVCHLHDHDTEEDRRRLERILNEDNPFLSANYDAWSHAPGYKHVSIAQAMQAFVRSRASLVEWLASLPDHAWTRPARNAIFGPTTFEEMVRFATEHDRTHLRQMRSAIITAQELCDVH
jgi:ribonucleotide monophosphatase NagD (HAD superfamily)